MLNLTLILYLRLIIISVGDDVPIDNEVVLMTDFVNFKIKSAQSLEGAHRDRMYVFRVINDRMHINI
jgi:hypothetical protein